MSRARVALLVAVLLSAAAALGYGLLSSRDTTRPPSPSLRPLIARAALEPCFGEVASRSGAKGLIPDLRLPCLDGDGSRSLLWTGTRRQVPTVVNLYGAWCGPCYDEMPILRRLHEAAGPKLRLLGIDTEDDQRLALRFALDPKVKQKWPALRDDDGRVLRGLGGGPPQTLLVDGAGTVVYVRRGVYQKYEQLTADIRRYLGVQL